MAPPADTAAHGRGLRVLVVTQSYPPDHSGSGLRIEATYARLRRRFDVRHVVVTRSPERALVPGIAPAAVRVAAGPIGLVRLVTEVARHARRSDVAHLVGLTRETRLAALVLRALGVGYTVEPTVEPPPASGRRGPVRRLTDRLLLGNPHLVALTPDIAALHRPARDLPGACHVRPNPWVPRDGARPDPVGRGTPRQATGEVPDGDGPGIVRHLVLGRLTPRKGHEQALRWLRALPDEHHLLIAGPLKQSADQAYLRHLRDLVRADRRLRDRVEIRPGYVADPGPLLAEVDAVWIPSTVEGMPNVAVEAWCEGTPVIMGDWLGAAAWAGLVPGSGAAIGPDGGAEIPATLARAADRETLRTAARRAFDLDHHVEGFLTHLAGATRAGRK